ncbi:MAG TPA: hypothetical protein VM032_01725 [Vicinamibacterales bacterium]|nr:hypothetical protein [Vicinamibacterales bacterium]
MTTSNSDARQTPVEEHSLPGTNQAGKGAECDETPDHESSSTPPPNEAQLEEHSLPGTNQAGKTAAR